MKIIRIVGFVLVAVMLFIAAIWVINYFRMDLSKEDAAIVREVRQTLNESGRRVSWFSFVRITRAQFDSRLIRSVNSNETFEAKKGEYYLISFSKTFWSGPSATYVVEPSSREIIGYIPGTQD